MSSAGALPPPTTKIALFTGDQLNVLASGTTATDSSTPGSATPNSTAATTQQQKITSLLTSAFASEQQNFVSLLEHFQDGRNRGGFLLS